MLWLELLKKHWKTFLVLVAIVASGLTGYHYGHKSASSGAQVVTTDSQTQTADNKKINVDTQKKTTDNKTVVIDKKPNGEVITTINDSKTTQTDKEKSSTEDKQTATSEKQTTSQAPAVATDPYRPSYSLGLEWSPYFANPEKMNEYQVDLGYRAIGNLWVTALFNIETHQAGVGVRIDF